MRAERAMTSGIHCIVASSGHAREQIKQKDCFANSVCFFEGGKKEEERGMEKDQKYILLGAPTWQLRHVQRGCQMV